jgi:uncharacterized protein YkwD
MAAVSPAIGASAVRHLLHILRFTLLVSLTAAILLPTPAAARSGAIAGTDKMRVAEARLLKDVNRIRVRAGLKPLRLDRRTSQVARARSADMAAKRYFAHVEPDGDDAHRLLRRRHIGASSVTENIGHTYGLSLRAGSNRMAKWWFRSPPHRQQMLARNANYIGIGIARRGNRLTYTAIFTRSRDKTKPRVVVKRAAAGGDGTYVTVAWRGVDPQLATGTAGVRSYELEQFTPASGWRKVGRNIRTSRRSFWAPSDVERYVRIRAVDRVGNIGPWSYARIEASGDQPKREALSSTVRADSGGFMHTPLRSAAQR